MESDIRNVLQYLAQLPEQVLRQLYADCWTCQAVLRILPPLAQQYLLRMLFLDEGAQLSLETIQSWLRKAPVGEVKAVIPGRSRSDVASPFGSLQSEQTSVQDEHLDAIEKLSALKIIVISSTNQSLIMLNPLFRTNLKVNLAGSAAAPWSNSRRKDTKQRHPPPDQAALLKYSRQSWEAVLHLMVGSEPEFDNQVPTTGVVQLLLKTGLISTHENSISMTSKGFQFLLKNVYHQLWILLLAYIETSETRRLSKVDVLTFFFRLSFLEAGKEYAVKRLTASQKIVVKDLREFGLIYMRKAASRRYVPTRLAVNLMSGFWEKMDEQAESNSKYIIVETNFKVYAYTSSSLQIALLGLFVHLQYRLPNLISGLITRESVRSALVNGISSSQILSFLEQHAHVQTKRNFVAIPETVADQIRIWEAERNRVSFQKGVFYHEFETQSDFERTVAKAAKENLLLWSGEGKRMLVKESGHDIIKNFIRNLK